jgi:hypothetical protein
MQSSFNAGVFGRNMRGRVDMEKWGAGLADCRNFIPLVQGCLKKRSGFNMADFASRGWLIPFRFSERNAFTLEFTEFKVRFFTKGGKQLTGGGAEVSVVTPYTADDLFNDDGTCALSFAQTGDVVFITHGKYPQQRLTRYANDNWVFEPVVYDYEPIELAAPDNTDKLFSTAETGTVTIFAQNAGGSPVNKFTAAMVGDMVYFEQPLDYSVPPWEVGKAITAGVERTSDGNTYLAMTSGKTGASKPVFLEGTRPDGTAPDGVSWQYLHSGWGIARITAFVSASQVTATVVKRIPKLVLTTGTTRYGFSAWNETAGYPTHVCFHRERMCLVRKAQVWLSVVRDFLNHALREGSDITPDMAITLDITSDELNEVTFLVPSNNLLIGTEGAEHAVMEISTNEGFSSGNVKAVRQSQVGSRQVIPQMVGDGVVFAQRQGRKIRELLFTSDTMGYQSTDLTVINDEALNGQVVQMAFHGEPYQVLWCACANGELASFTFNKEQQVMAWHTHPLGGDGKVESVAVIPNADTAEDELWILVSRTVNGSTVRTIEYMSPDFNPFYIPREQSNYLDSSKTYDGTNYDPTFTVSMPATLAGVDATASFSQAVTALVDDLIVITLSGVKYYAEVKAILTANTLTVRPLYDIPLITAVSTWSRAVDSVSGVTHMLNQTARIAVDGGAHPDVVVSAGGVVNLNSRFSIIRVGYPVASYMKTLNMEAGSQNGTAQGKIKRIHKVMLRLLDSLGGRIGVGKVIDNLGYYVTVFGQPELIDYRSPEMLLNNVPSLFTGDRIISVDGGYDSFGQIEIYHDEPLPFTIVAISPHLETQDPT